MRTCPRAGFGGWQSGVQDLGPCRSGRRGARRRAHSDGSSVLTMKRLSIDQKKKPPPLPSEKESTIWSSVCAALRAEPPLPPPPPLALAPLPPPPLPEAEPPSAPMRPSRYPSSESSKTLERSAAKALGARSRKKMPSPSSVCTSSVNA